MELLWLPFLLLGVLYLVWIRLDWANDKTLDERLALARQLGSFPREDQAAALETFNSVSYNRHFTLNFFYFYLVKPYWTWYNFAPPNSSTTTSVKKLST